jgi:hypothetical protein
MATALKLIVVEGNAAADRSKIARSTVEQLVPGAVITNVQRWGRTPDGFWPVYAIEYEEGP